MPRNIYPVSPRNIDEVYIYHEKTEVEIWIENYRSRKRQLQPGNFCEHRWCMSILISWNESNSSKIREKKVDSYADVITFITKLSFALLTGSILYIRSVGLSTHWNHLLVQQLKRLICHNRHLIIIVHSDMLCNFFPGIGSSNWVTFCSNVS